MTTENTTSQKFVEFIILQAQNAAFCMGQIPDPQSGESVKNLPMAKLMIDHLQVVREKSEGNLSSEEENLLGQTLTSLQMAFVEASAGEETAFAGAEDEGCCEGSCACDHDEDPVDESKDESKDVGGASDDEEDDKRKFVKSYGA